MIAFKLSGVKVLPSFSIDAPLRSLLFHGNGLSKHPKTLEKHRKVRFLSSPLQNPGFPRVFGISGEFLWPSVAPMQLGAWSLRRCISRRATKIESFFESRESPNHSGFAYSDSALIHTIGAVRIRTI
jgi:hypothetical protein